MGGLLFGFDTVVISGAIDALAKLYHLSDYGKGWTVAIALIGTVVGSFTAGVVGQKLGSRETLRITAILYVFSALGSALAWSRSSLMVFRFIGGLGIGASSVLGPVYIAELAPAKWRGRLTKEKAIHVPEWAETQRRITRIGVRLIVPSGRWRESEPGTTPLW